MLRRNPAFQHLAMDRAAVLLHAAEHSYFAVNHVGARIWALLETPRTVSELVRILMEQFVVEETACRRETEAFLQQMLDRGLLVAVG